MTRLAGVFLPDTGPPRQVLSTCGPVEAAGLLGSDYPGLKLRALVAEGDLVAAGTPVLADRARPDRVVTAPLAGRVEEVSIGARRRVALLSIRAEGDDAVTFKPARAESAEGLRALLMETGLWNALLRRPFGHIPDPAETPAAIVVPALDTEPGAVDPAPFIAARGDDFARGLAALERLTEGPVHVCQAPGGWLAERRGRIRRHVFAGGHPAGLPGVQIERLAPVGRDRPVWHMGWADVLDLGELLQTGRLPLLRIVSLCGPRAADPRLLELPLGTALEQLAATEASPGPRRVLSGSALSGRESRFLRRRHTQITLLSRDPMPETRRPTGWLRQIPAKRAALVPHAALGRCIGPDIPAIPLLRALSVGETEAAERLGALGLVEEDMALASYLSGGTEDFGQRLRDVLDQLEQGA